MLKNCSSIWQCSFDIPCSCRYGGRGMYSTVFKRMLWCWWKKFWNQCKQL